MQRAMCPICERMWLRRLQKYAPHKGETVVCQNEYTIHVERNGQHFLAKTERAILEENGVPTQTFELVLN